jgi:hypothetical protein
MKRDYKRFTYRLQLTENGLIKLVDNVSPNKKKILSFCLPDKNGVEFLGDINNLQDGDIMEVVILKERCPRCKKLLRE